MAENVTGVQLDAAQTRDLIHQTRSILLDRSSFAPEPTEGRGRWFNVPIAHPITKRAFATDDEAIDFAVERGYMGIGFPTQKHASTYSAMRGTEVTELSDVLTVWSMLNTKLIDADLMRNIRTPLVSYKQAKLMHEGDTKKLGRFLDGLGGSEHPSDMLIELTMPTKAERDAFAQARARLHLMKFDGSDIPFNTGGRAPDGFHYQFMDQVIESFSGSFLSKPLPEVRSVENHGPTKPPVRTEGMADFFKPLVGAAP
jgi:hypothetical protein